MNRATRGNPIFMTHDGAGRSGSCGKETAQWLEPPQGLSIVPGAVHAWRILVEDAAPHLSRLEQLLTPVEREQVARFFREADRTSRTVARGMLRSLLATYLETSPDAVAIVSGHHGKPMLDPETHRQSIEFSVSHSGNVVLLAFSVDAAVGIDVEAIRTDVDLSGLVARVLTSEEADVLRQADESARTQIFFRTWARKEAVLKALGTGFSVEPDRVAVLTSSLAECCSCVCYDPEGNQRHFRVLDLAAGQAFAAAIVVERADAEVRLFSGSRRAAEV